MNTTNTRLAAIFATCLIFSGCQKSQPSTSDIEATIAERYSACQPVSLKDFKRENGTENQDGTYTVKVSYNLQVSAIPESTSTWDAWREISDKYNAIEAERKSKVEAADKAWNEERDRLRKELNALSAEEGKSEERAALVAKDQEVEQSRDKYLKQYREESEARLIEAGIKAEDASHYRTFQAMSDNFKAACKGISNKVGFQLVRDAFPVETPLIAMEHLAKGVTIAYTEELKFIKTENGWRQQL